MNFAKAVLLTGGKDSVVMLHQLSQHGELDHCAAFSFHTKDRCDEVDLVLEQYAQRYSIKITPIYGTSLKECTWKMHAEFPNIKCVYMGVRQGDSAHITNDRQMADEGWPVLELIYPIFSLDYNSVWQTIIANDLPHCALYYYGYSSLGENKSDSKQNPHLIVDGTTFKKPWELSEPNSERLGRYPS